MDQWDTCKKIQYASNTEGKKRIESAVSAAVEERPELCLVDEVY